MISTKLGMTTTLQQEICLKKMAVGSNIESIQEVSAINHQIQQACQTHDDEHCFGLPYQDHNYGAPPPVRQSTPPPLSHQYSSILLKSNLLNGNASYHDVLQVDKNGLVPPNRNNTNSIPISNSLPIQNGINHAGTSKNNSNYGLPNNVNGLSNNFNEVKKLEDVTRCICGFTHDDGYMICCDRCAVWQHIDCMNINRNNIPETYLCDYCNPRKLNKEQAKLLQARKKEDLSMLSELESSDMDTGDEKDLPSYTAVQSTPTSLTITSNRGNKKNEGVTGKKRKRSKDDKHAGKRTNSTEKKQARSRSKSSCTDSIDEDFMGISFAWERKLREWKEIYREIENSSHTSELLQAVLTSSSKLPNHKNIEENVLFKLHKQLVKVNQLRNKLVAIEDIPVKQPVIEVKGSYMLSKQSEVTSNTQFKKPYPYVFHYNGFDGLEITVDSRTSGNISRFLRRSCCPNCEIQHVIENKKLHLFVVTKQNITRGNEITIPFDFKYQNCQYNVDCACSRFKECPVYKFTNMRIQMEHKLKSKSENRRLSPLRLSLNRIHSGESNGYTSSEHDSHLHEAESEENQRKKSREERKMEAYIRQIEKMEKLEKKREQQHLLSPTDNNSKDGLTSPFSSSLNADHTHSNSLDSHASVVTPARRVIRRKSGRGGRRQARRGRNLSMEGVTSPLTNLIESDSNHSCDLDHANHFHIPLFSSASPLTTNTPTTGISVKAVPSLDVSQATTLLGRTPSISSITSATPNDYSVSKNANNKPQQSETQMLTNAAELPGLKQSSDTVSNVTESLPDNPHTSCVNLSADSPDSKTEISPKPSLPLVKTATEGQPVTNVSKTVSADPSASIVLSEDVASTSKKPSSVTEETPKASTSRRGNMLEAVKKPKVKPWDYKPGTPNGQVHIGAVRGERKYLPHSGTYLKKHWLTKAFNESLVFYGPINNPEKPEPAPITKPTIKSFKKQLILNFTTTETNKNEPATKDLIGTNDTESIDELSAQAPLNKPDLLPSVPEQLNTHSNLPVIEYENLSDDDDDDCEENIQIVEPELLIESADQISDNKTNEDIVSDVAKPLTLSNEELLSSTTKKKVSLQEYLKRSKESGSTTTPTSQKPSKNVTEKTDFQHNKTITKPTEVKKSVPKSTEKTCVIHKSKPPVTKALTNPQVKQSIVNKNLSSISTNISSTPLGGKPIEAIKQNNINNLKSPKLKRSISNDKTSNAKVIEGLSQVLESVVGSGKGIASLNQISDKVLDMAKKLIKNEAISKQHNNVSRAYSDTTRTIPNDIYYANKSNLDHPTKTSQDRVRWSSKNSSPARKESPVYTRTNSVHDHRKIHVTQSARNSSQASPVTPINSPRSSRHSGLNSPSTPKIHDNQLGQRVERDSTSTRGSFEIESTRSRHNSGTSTGSSSTMSRSPRRDHYNSYKQERSREPSIQKPCTPTISSQPIPSLIRSSGARVPQVIYNRRSSPVSTSPPVHWSESPNDSWAHSSRSNDHYYHNNNPSPTPPEQDYRSGKHHHLERFESWPPPRDKNERSGHRPIQKSNHYYHPYPNDGRGGYYSRDNHRTPSPGPQRHSPMDYYGKPPSSDSYRSKYYHPDHHRR